MVGLRLCYGILAAQVGEKSRVLKHKLGTYKKLKCKLRSGLLCLDESLVNSESVVYGEQR